MIEFTGDIYVGTERSEAELVAIVSQTLGAKASPIGNIETGCLSLSVRGNPDREAPMMGKYEFMIEFESDDTDLSSDSFVQLSALLESLWKNEMKTETACEFENELPHNGRFDGAGNKPIVYDDSPPV